MASYVKDNESKVPESFKTARSQSEEAPDEDDESDLVIDESLVDAGAPKKADKRPVPGLIPINQVYPELFTYL